MWWESEAASGDNGSCGRTCRQNTPGEERSLQRAFSGSAMLPRLTSSGFHTPLRYPGGKGKLAPFIKSIFDANRLIDGHYAEVYAGGAAVSIELLLHEYVSHIYINDISPSVGAFWRCVLDRTDELCGLIHSTRVTMKEWRRQREIQTQTKLSDDLELAFSTFFLNRTNRSGNGPRYVHRGVNRSRGRCCRENAPGHRCRDGSQG